ncbi:ABC transporter permease [Thermithiobacillus plumbiphilus]|uniref:Iron export ABC transporter permease subunit FetB n=1 Tax=Thermithiobacillus plumbiphilus TaxID=1729899 RepID=A0ABU9DBB0_9PROT
MAADLFTHFDIQILLGLFGLLSITWIFSAWQRLGVGRELAWSALRATLQLGGMGFVLTWLFALHQPLVLLLFLILMVLMAGGFNAKRGKGIRHAYWIGVASIGLSTTLLLAWMLGSGLIAFEGRVLIPLGGMLIGNAMNAVSLALDRLRAEIRNQEAILLAMAALGANARQMLAEIYPQVTRSALIPTIDSLKSVGLIHIPGITAGMILAGSPPLKAVGMQLLVMFMLTAVTALATFSAVLLAGPLALRFGGEENPA